MRKPTVRWVEAAKAWRSDVGPRSTTTGRRTPKYFYELPNTPKGRRQAEEKLDVYLKQRDKEEAAFREDANNPHVWTGLVEPFLAACWARVDAGELSDETYRSHRERLLVWCAWTPDGEDATGDRVARSLTDDDAARWVASLKDRGLSATRISGLMSSVNTCLTWGASRVSGREPKVILPGGNPFDGVKVDPPDRRRIRVATRDEVARFLRAARAEVEPWTLSTKGRCQRCRMEVRPGPCRRSHNLRSVYFRAAILLCRLQAASGTRPKELCTAGWESQVEDKPGWTARAWRDGTGKPVRWEPRIVADGDGAEWEVLDPVEWDGTGQWWGLIVVAGKTYAKTGRVRSIPVPPLLARAIERLRRSGLSDSLIFPRLTRDGGPGLWTTSAIDGRVRKWRLAAKLSDEFQLYALRHRYYTAAIHRAGLSADQAGAIGGTSGEVVRRKYLQEDQSSMFEGAAKVRRSR